MTNALRSFRNQKTEIRSEVTEVELPHPRKEEQRTAREGTGVTLTVVGKGCLLKCSHH